MDFDPVERGRYALLNGDIVIVDSSGSEALVGRSAIWREEILGCCYQNHVIRFRPHAVEPEYAHLVFRFFALTGAFSRVARGIGILHLGAKRLSEMDFPLPPLPEQWRIVADATRRLDLLRESEASLRSALRKSEEQQHLTLSAAVTGALLRLTPSSPAESASPQQTRRKVQTRGLGKQPRTKIDPLPSLFEPLQVEIESEPLPKGWIWTSIDDVGEVRLGRQLASHPRDGAVLKPYLRVANVFEELIDTSDVKEMYFTSEEMETYRLEYGDILLNEGQSIELVGRPAMVRGELQDVGFQNSLIRFRALPVVRPEYALIVFRNYLHSGAFQKIARHSTNIAHLGLGRFRSMPFPLPPLDEQDRIITEAQRRLTAALATAETVRGALNRLEDMEREVIIAAVTGTLVPQNADDEPAEALLARLGPPLADLPELSTSSTTSDAEAYLMVRQDRRGTGSPRSLFETLQEAGRPLSLPELFTLAGYDRDSTDHVEHFYLQLHDALRTYIQPIGQKGENTTVEVISEAR